MTVIKIPNVWFNDAITLVMGEAFDHASASLRNFGSAVTMREMIAKRIIASAKNGERDPTRLYRQALIPFGIEDLSMFVVSVGRDPSSADEADAGPEGTCQLRQRARMSENY
jgi:hypothetical protein